MTNVSDGLAQLNKIFIGQLPRRVDDISIQLEKLLSITWDVAHLERVYRQVHGLTGSAGTFGFPRISDAARPLELELAQLLGQPTPPMQTSLLYSALQHLLTVVKNELGQPPVQLFAHARKLSKKSMIYVVDNDIEQGEHLRAILAADNYQTKVFNTLHEFRYACEFQAWPNVVIMDINSPEGPHAGTNTISELHKICPTTLHVVFISVRDDLETRLLAYHAGASRYLVKPLHPASLHDLMARLTLRPPADPYRVLLVDDDALLGKAMSAILQQSGMKVRIASSPLRAIQALHEFDPDVLLLDLYMPNCSGTDLAMVLREQEHSIALQIIFLSTETDLSKQNLALKLGGDDFLVKPVQASTLVQTVSNHALRKREIIRGGRQIQQRELEKNRQQIQEAARQEQHLHAEFLAQLSDPLRSPLNAIMGYAQLIHMDEMSGDGGESARDSALEISKSGQQLLALINDILDLSKIDASRMEVHIGPVWLDELFIACEPVHQALAANRKIHLRFQKCEHKNIILNADASHLIRILKHLVLYAIKCSPPHSKVEVSWQTHHPHRLRIHIHCQIPSAIIDNWHRIIHRSNDYGSSMSENNISLILSHYLAELMKAEIGVGLGAKPEIEQEISQEIGREMVQDRNSPSFWIDLPQLIDADFLQSDSMPETPPALQGKNAQDKSKVLHIEDNITNLRLMRKIFLKRPHLALSDEQNAERGIALARVLQPDLILLDLNLPGMNGYNALIELRRIPSMKETPIIAVTANAMKGDAERILAAGFNAYITKPINLTMLYAMIDNLLPAPEQAAPDPDPAPAPAPATPGA
jgi:DNA-binding response OmpR family regulator